MNLIPMGPNCGEPVSSTILRDRIRHWVLRITNSQGKDLFWLPLNLMPASSATVLLRPVNVAGLSVSIEHCDPTATRTVWAFDLNRIEETLPTFDAVRLEATRERPVLILTKRSADQEDSVWIVGTEVKP